MLDLLVLTSANARQASAYAMQLRARRAEGRLDLVRRFGVIPDPRGVRVGSGAATLLALRRIARHLARQRPSSSAATLFHGQRIVILHSGGDSRRLPAYAAQGKAFAPLPLDSDPDGTLFDAILRDLARIPLPEEGRTLIAAGDVLLGVGDALPCLHRSGVTGVAYRDSIERATRHGAYVAASDRSVEDFVHKGSPEELERRGAIWPDGTALIDTGLLSLCPLAVEAWLGAAGVGEGPDFAMGAPLRLALDGRLSIDLYAEMLHSMSDRAHRAAPSHWRHGVEFHAEIADRCDFLHLGSTREFLNELTDVSPARSGSRAQLACPAGIRTVCCSFPGPAPPDVIPPSLLDGCESRGPVRLAGHNLLVGLPASSRLEVDLPREVGLVALPIGSDAWSALLFGTEDDFKSTRAADGTFLNRQLDLWLEGSGLSPVDIWDVSDPTRQTLWNARLWTCGRIDRVLQVCAWMCRGEAPPPEWLKLERRTAPEVYAATNLRRLLSRRRNLRDRIRVQVAVEGALKDRSLGAPEIRRVAVGHTQLSLARARLRRALPSITESLDRARLHGILHALGGGEAAAARALRAVSSVIEREVSLPQSPRRAVVPPGEGFEATAPARIDLAGGWSDTPPICHELGGRVVNASIAIRGSACVVAHARLIRERLIRISSLDLNESMELRDSDALAAHADPSHWAALPLCTLLVSGLAPSGPGADLADWLARVGGGVELTIESRVPKGSGLGTSSILSAAAISALSALTGDSDQPEAIFAKTSLLEQLMRTGGGWQDQVGGIVGGFKLTRSEPGPVQHLAVQPLAIASGAQMELRSRAVLIDTGIQRMARGILRHIVLRYLAREAGVVGLVRKLHANAESMASALIAGDIDHVGQELGEYWALKRELDPGSCPASIEALTSTFAGRAHWALAGAGGGGFLFAIAHDARQADMLRSMPGSVPFELAEDGLRVRPLSQLTNRPGHD
ncbi:MAG: hypothetical protein H6811_04600 [Phycisphaeraceae bacterium]|nr:hypothetical protein [Phycisphaeraceae bacterium]